MVSQFMPLSAYLFQVPCHSMKIKIKQAIT